jgi:site-specific DNA-methyltransferase (adenine-specific)
MKNGWADVLEHREFEDGHVLLADSTTANMPGVVRELAGDVPLIATDPPYGNIVNEAWDKTSLTDEKFAQWMFRWTVTWQTILLDRGAFYVWGGIGKPGFRPFLKYLMKVEEHARTDLNLANLITWSKKRAYGVKHNYLFTREECAYFCKGDIKKPLVFNIPLLSVKRGYAGYNKKYPAKSEFKRRTNVWMDTTEVMRNKKHPTEKAARVVEIPIEVHTNPGDWVVDPFAGCGTTGIAARKLGRKFVLIEQDEEHYRMMVERLSEKDDDD